MTNPTYAKSSRRGLRTRDAWYLPPPNGAEALKVIAAERIDALVSDIRMPVMDGITLVRTIYERKLAIPSIIFVSGCGNLGTREMYGLGVEAQMEKPLDRKDLLCVLEKSLTEIEQKWLTLSAYPMVQSCSMGFESLEEATRCYQFQLGWGGCSFASTQLLTEKKTTSLTIRLAKEDLCLGAQGRVRWFDGHTAKAGMSFDYLDP